MTSTTTNHGNRNYDEEECRDWCTTTLHPSSDWPRILQTEVSWSIYVRPRIRNNISQYIRLLELHLPESSDLPPQYPTTNGLPLYLYDALKKVLKMAEPDFTASSAMCSYFTHMLTNEQTRTCELMNQGTLSDMIEASGGMPKLMAACYTFQLLNGIYCMHCRIFHYDLKPGNVLVFPGKYTRGHRLNLCDLGLAMFPAEENRRKGDCLRHRRKGESPWGPMIELNLLGR